MIDGKIIENQKLTYENILKEAIKEQENNALIKESSKPKRRNKSKFSILLFG
ncbi:hypothetical protein MASR2M15_01910 [Anaerolineales bacterium]